jgi:hypothetical protein
MPSRSGAEGGGMSSFDSTKIALPDIIKDIVHGKVQLPDFQRGWVWDDQHVRSLLVSITRSFPVGAVMLLETGGDVRFQVRPIENLVFEGKVPDPDKLILDGQQRLTSLTQVLALDRPVKTFDEKGKHISRYYYIDIDAALAGEMSDEALVAVEDDRKIKTNFGRDVMLDLSSPKLECEHFHFPCNQILNSDRWEESLQEYASEKFSAYMQFRRKVLNAFRSYQIPVIALSKSTSKEAVCLVFEKVNTGGVSLSVFELVTASFAADNYNLRDDWYGNPLRGVQGREERIKAEPILASIEPTDFLQAITLLQTYENRQADIAAGKIGKAASAVSAKRVSVLALDLNQYKRWADQVERGFVMAAKFLRKECFFAARDLPYRTQIVPLAAVLSILKERWLEPKIYDRLARWYWCGVLGELYGGAVETRIANDLEDLIAWIEKDGTEPRTVTEASFIAQRLHTLRSRLSAAYKGVNILVLREGSKDFFWKASVQELDFEEVSLDIHHIFPKAWCEANDIKAAAFNSIINKTPISYKANRMIGGRSPSEYLGAIQNHKQVGLNNEQMDAILRSHLIAPDRLRANDFNAFMQQREKQLLELISHAMGKSVHEDAAISRESIEDEYKELEAA